MAMCGSWTGFGAEFMLIAGAVIWFALSETMRFRNTTCKFKRKEILGLKVVADPRVAERLSQVPLRDLGSDLYVA